MPNLTGPHALLGVEVALISELDLTALIVGCAAGLKAEPYGLKHAHLLRIVAALSNSLDPVHLLTIRMSLFANGHPLFVGVAQTILTRTVSTLASVFCALTLELPP